MLTHNFIILFFVIALSSSAYSSNQSVLDDQYLFNEYFNYFNTTYNSAGAAYKINDEELQKVMKKFENLFEKQDDDQQLDQENLEEQNPPQLPTAIESKIKAISDNDMIKKAPYVQCALKLNAKERLYKLFSEIDEKYWNFAAYLFLLKSKPGETIQVFCDTAKKGKRSNDGTNVRKTYQKTKQKSIGSYVRWLFLKKFFGKIQNLILWKKDEGSENQESHVPCEEGQKFCETYKKFFTEVPKGDVEFPTLSPEAQKFLNTTKPDDKNFITTMKELYTLLYKFNEVDNSDSSTQEELKELKDRYRCYSGLKDTKYMCRLLNGSLDFNLKTTFAKKIPEEYREAAAKILLDEKKKS